MVGLEGDLNGILDVAVPRAVRFPPEVGVVPNLPEVGVLPTLPAAAALRKPRGVAGEGMLLEVLLFIGKPGDRAFIIGDRAIIAALEDVDARGDLARVGVGGCKWVRTDAVDANCFFEATGDLTAAAVVPNVRVFVRDLAGMGDFTPSDFAPNNVLVGGRRETGGA